MKRPPIDGVVERRLLINYRADPEVVAALLPAGLRPQLVRDQAVVGICLIRMGSLRPAGLPAAIGRRSENAAHRFAVEWDTEDGPARGVYIPRRDTSVPLNVLAGGRLFPGVCHRADFDVVEDQDRFRVGFAARDGSTSVAVDTTQTAALGSRLFDDPAAASAFFEAGCVGLSPARDGRTLEGLELSTPAWSVAPVRVDEARSSYFDDPDRFPPGSVTLDCGLVMRDVPVRWRAAPGPEHSSSRTRGTDKPGSVGLVGVRLGG